MWSCMLSLLPHRFTKFTFSPFYTKCGGFICGPADDTTADYLRSSHTTITDITVVVHDQAIGLITSDSAGGPCSCESDTLSVMLFTDKPMAICGSGFKS